MQSLASQKSQQESKEQQLLRGLVVYLKTSPMFKSKHHTVTLSNAVNVIG